jgi:hypothetical protein
MKIFYESGNTWWPRTTPFPKDADLQNRSRQKVEREHTYKQYQGKAWATKDQQELSVNVVINSQLLACKAEIG